MQKVHKASIQKTPRDTMPRKENAQKYSGTIGNGI